MKNIIINELSELDILQMEFECINNKVECIDNIYTILNQFKKIRKVQNSKKVELDKKHVKIEKNEIELKKQKQGRKKKRVGKNAHISEHKGYELYRKPRVYDIKNQTWSLKNKNKFNINSNFYLPFTDVIIIAINFKNGVEVMDIINQVKSHTKSLSSECIRNYIKYWRAGSFNDAIFENARRFGYDPQELISTECRSI